MHLLWLLMVVCSMLGAKAQTILWHAGMQRPTDAKALKQWLRDSTKTQKLLADAQKELGKVNATTPPKASTWRAALLLNANYREWPVQSESAFRWRETVAWAELYPKLPEKEKRKLLTQQQDSSVVIQSAGFWDSLVASPALEAQASRTEVAYTLTRYKQLSPSLLPWLPKPKFQARLEQKLDSLNATYYQTLSSADSLEWYAPKSARYKDQLLKLATDIRFQQETGTGSLSQLKQYYSQYPASPYRPQVLERITKLSTYTSQPQTLLSFAQNPLWTGTAYATRAMLLASILLQPEEPDHKNIPDSLLWQLPLPIPTASGQWTWYNMAGETVLTVDSLPEEVCAQRWPHIAYGPTSKGIAFTFCTAASLVHYTDSLEYLGAGWYAATTKGTSTAWFMNNTSLPEPAQKWEVVENKYLLAWRGMPTATQLTLYSLMGQELLSGVEADEVEYLDGVLLFKKTVQIGPDSSYSLYAWLPERSFLNGEVWDTPKLTFKHRDAEVVRDGYWQLTLTDGRQGLLTATGQVVIPFQDHQIGRGPLNTWLVKNGTGYKLLNAQGRALHEGTYGQVRIGAKSIAYRKAGKWGVLGADGKPWQAAVWDSIQVISESVMQAQQGNVTLLEVGLGRWVNMPKGSTAELLTVPAVSESKTARKPSEFIVVKDSTGRCTLYNHAGSPVSTPPAFRVWRLTADLLALETEVQEKEQIPQAAQRKKNSKKAKDAKPKYQWITKRYSMLIDSTGREVLPPVYDGIAQQDGHNLLLLQAGKFGLYNIQKREVVLPRFNQSLQSLAGTNLYIGRIDSGAGLYAGNGNTVIQPKYRGFLPWNADAVWAETESGHQLINLKTKLPADTLPYKLGKPQVWLASRALNLMPVSTENSMQVLCTADGTIHINKGTEVHVRMAGARGWLLVVTEDKAENHTILEAYGLYPNGTSAPRAVMKLKLESRVWEQWFCNSNF